MNSGVPDLVVDEAQRLLHLVDSGEVLGATRQLMVLGDCLVALARAGARQPDLHSAVTSLVQHIEQTRGESSQAVINGIQIMAAPTLNPADDNLAVSIESAVASFREALNGWVSGLRAHATNVLAPHTRFLAYDYSSTVSSVLADLSRAGRDITIFVPEARSLGGGAKYLADWQDLGITAHLIPDAALGWALQQSDVALVGAETLSAEGGCYNTIGTALTAHEAQRLRVPFYVLTILLKTDHRTCGGGRPIPSLDFTSIASLPVQPRNRGIKIRGAFPDLDYTPPTMITAVITEQGSLRASDVDETARSLISEGVVPRG